MFAYFPTNASYEELDVKKKTRTKTLLSIEMIIPYVYSMVL